MRCKMVSLTDHDSFDPSTAEGFVNDALRALENEGQSVVLARLAGHRQEVLMILFEAASPPPQVNHRAVSGPPEEERAV